LLDGHAISADFAETTKKRDANWFRHQKVIFDLCAKNFCDTISLPQRALLANC
jgi:hypothetical protein